MISYTCKIKLNCEKELSAKIIEIFAPEDKELSNERGKYEVKEDNSNLLFNIDAKDTTALKTVINSILKNIALVEKIEKIDPKQIN